MLGGTGSCGITHPRGSRATVCAQQNTQEDLLSTEAGAGVWPWEMPADTTVWHLGSMHQEHGSPDSFSNYQHVPLSRQQCLPRAVEKRHQWTATERWLLGESLAYLAHRGSRWAGPGPQGGRGGTHCTLPTTRKMPLSCFGGQINHFFFVPLFYSPPPFC